MNPNDKCDRLLEYGHTGPAKHPRSQLDRSMDQ